MNLKSLGTVGVQFGAQVLASFLKPCVSVAFHWDRVEVNLPASSVKGTPVLYKPICGGLLNKEKEKPEESGNVKS